MTDGTTNTKFSGEIISNTTNTGNAAAKVGVDTATQEKTCTCEELMQKADVEKNKLLGSAKSVLQKEQANLDQLAARPGATGGSHRYGLTSLQQQYRDQSSAVSGLSGAVSDLESAPPHTFLEGAEAAQLYKCETILSNIESAQADFDNPGNVQTRTPNGWAKSQSDIKAAAAQDIQEGLSAYCGVIKTSAAEIASMSYDGRSAAEALVIGSIPGVGTADAAGEVAAKAGAGRYGDAVLASIGIVPVLGKPIGRGIKALSRLGRRAVDAASSNRTIQRARSSVLGPKQPAPKPAQQADETPRKQGSADEGQHADEVAKNCRNCG